jgi:hypothetical protein
MKKLTVLCSLTFGLLLFFVNVTAQEIVKDETPLVLEEETPSLPPHISFTEGEVVFADGAKAERGNVISENDELITKNGTAEVTLPQGGIFIEKDSHLVFLDLEKPVISLLKGKIYLTLKSEIEVKSNDETLKPTEGLWQVTMNQEGRVELAPREPYITDTAVAEPSAEATPEPTEEAQTTEAEAETEEPKIEESEEHNFRLPLGIHVQFLPFDFYFGFYPAWYWYYYHPFYWYYWSWYEPWYPRYNNYYYSDRYGYNDRNNSVRYGRQTISSSQLQNPATPVRGKIASVSSSRASVSSVGFQPSSVRSTSSVASIQNRISSVSSQRATIQNYPSRMTSRSSEISKTTSGSITPKSSRLPVYSRNSKRTSPFRAPESSRTVSSPRSYSSPSSLVSSRPTTSLRSSSSRPSVFSRSSFSSSRFSPSSRSSSGSIRRK